MFLLSGMLRPAGQFAIVVLAVLAGLAPAAAQDDPQWWTAPLGGGSDTAGSTGIASSGSVATASEAYAGAGEDRPSAIDCLAKAIGYEAANEPLAGRQAVAQVILNRTRHKAFPKTICGVVYQGSARRTGCQFTFTCDGSLRRALTPRTWSQSVDVARQAIEGRLPPTVGGATHYHAGYVSPRWAPSLVKVASIGAHIFYRFPGSAGSTGGVYSAPAAAAPGPTNGQGFSPWGLSPTAFANTGF